MIEFKEWPKIARLNREIIVSEKLDGSNAAIGIKQIDNMQGRSDLYDDPYVYIHHGHNEDYAVWAQSRTRIITPEQDNFGFARWVYENNERLIGILSEGLHFGEYWGSGIQRGYGLSKGEKRFSLFNTPRYVTANPTEKQINVSGLKDIGVGVVPVLYQGPFSQGHIKYALNELGALGSYAAPGYMNPEGVVVFHTAAQLAFKVTLKDDEKPKGSKENG